jgi:putative ABC transport system permease protein
VIAMLAIGEGASHEAQEQIRKLGSQNIILQSVKPPDGQGSSAESRSLISEYGITRRDVTQIQETVPGISIVVPSRYITENIWNLDRSIDGQVMGVLPIYPTMRNREMVAGRFFTELEMQERMPVCVLNQTVASKLFALTAPVGKSVRVKGYYYRVVGVIQDEGQSIGTDASASGSSAAAQIMIPADTLMDQYGETFFRYRTGSFEAEKVEYHEAVVRVEDVTQVESRAEALRHLMRTNHKKEDWRIIVPVELLKQAERTKQIFSIVLGSIAAISLIVGGIGIMNIMLASVTERTREIGIRRALGARQADIVVQFLIETVLLAGVGGVLGVIVGLAAARISADSGVAPSSPFLPAGVPPASQASRSTSSPGNRSSSTSGSAARTASRSTISSSPRMTPASRKRRPVSVPRPF